MRDTTAAVFCALIVGVCWCVHRWVLTWGEVRRARVETDNIHARAELERASHRPVPGRARGGEAETSSLHPMSNVRPVSPD